MDNSTRLVFAPQPGGGHRIIYRGKCWSAHDAGNPMRWTSDVSQASAVVLDGLREERITALPEEPMPVILQISAPATDASGTPLWAAYDYDLGCVTAVKARENATVFELCSLHRPAARGSTFLAEMVTALGTLVCCVQDDDRVCVMSREDLSAALARAAPARPPPAATVPLPSRAPASRPQPPPVIMQRMGSAGLALSDEEFEAFLVASAAEAASAAAATAASSATSPAASAAAVAATTAHGGAGGASGGAGGAGGAGARNALLRQLAQERQTRRAEGGAGGGGGGASSMPAAAKSTFEEDVALAARLAAEEESRFNAEKAAEQASFDAWLAANPEYAATEAPVTARTAVVVKEGSCVICGDEFADSACGGVRICSGDPPHDLCPTCAVNMVRTQIANGTDSIRCSLCPPPRPTPTTGSTPLLQRVSSTGTAVGVIHYEAVEHISELCVLNGGKIPGQQDGPDAVRALTAEEMKRFRSTIVLVAAKRSGVNVVRCPSAACAALIWGQEGPPPKDTDPGVHAACPSCNAALCSICGVAWKPSHSGVSCAAFKIAETPVDRDEFVRALGGAAAFRPCPGCGTAIQHFRGHHCHHIAPRQGANAGGCAVCHTHFCYVCGVVLQANDALAHYRSGAGACAGKLWCDPQGKCGCPICPDCKPGTPCGSCSGGCPSCSRR